jgi:hypothetical protein
LFAALIAAACAAALLAGPASAASYSVYSCAGPDGKPLPNNAWSARLSVPSHSAAFSFGTACSDLTVAATPGTALAAGEDAGYVFNAPANTKISGYQLRRSASIAYPASGTHPSLSAGLRRTTDGVSTYWGECETVTSDCTLAFGGTQSVGLSASSLQVGVECGSWLLSCSGSGINVLRARLIDSRVDISDSRAPSLAVTGGNLPDAVAFSGARTLSLATSDLGGGVRSVTLSVDGVAKATVSPAGSCSVPFTTPVPCPLATNANFTVNLGDYPPGKHSVVVSATDAAGNVKALAPIRFTIGGVVANGKPGVEFPTLTTKKALISTKSSKRKVVSGALRTSTGQPIAGAKLDVYKANVVGPSTKMIRIGSTKTSAKGRFSFKVRPRGALLITFVFRPAAGAHGTASASTTLRHAIRLSARGSRSALGRGGSFKIVGKISGAGTAARGASVEIEVKNGKSWTSVAALTAGKGGAYKWKHRFTKVTRPTLFRFRAIVRAKQGWPWPSRTSPVVRVLVSR